MKGIQIAAFVLMILSTVGVGLFLIPLAWCIPMTVHYYKHPSDCSVGFKVCSLLFVSFIGGILMLCDDSPKNEVKTIEK